jgi:putative ABC transport system permease protein
VTARPYGVGPRHLRSATIPEPMIIEGGGVAALADDRNGVLISHEIAADFEVGVRANFPVTIYPDELDVSQKLSLHVLGIYGAIPRTDPRARW